MADYDMRGTGWERLLESRKAPRSLWKYGRSQHAGASLGVWPCCDSEERHAARAASHPDPHSSFQASFPEGTDCPTLCVAASRESAAEGRPLSAMAAQGKESRPLDGTSCPRLVESWPAPVKRQGACVGCLGVCREATSVSGDGTELEKAVKVCYSF